MAERIRAFDWSRTPLGPLETWPQSLKTTVGVMLSTPHPMVVCWGPTFIEIYNDAYARMVGPDKHPAILGAPSAKAFPESWGLAGPDLQQVLTGGPPLAYENRLVPFYQDGAVQDRYWTYTYAPIHEPAAPEGIGGVLAICVDTTRTMTSLHDSEARYRTLFETMDEGFAVCEAIRGADGEVRDLRLIELNAAFERLSGIPASQALGRLATEVFPGLEPAALRSYGEAGSRGEPVRRETYVPSIDRWFDVRAFPRAGERLVVLYDDITERKRAEARLQESEERHAFLLQLSDVLRSLSDPAELRAEACRVLGEQLRGDVTCFADIDLRQGVAEIARDHVRGAAPSLVGTHRLAPFGEPLRERRPVGVEDVEISDRFGEAERAAYRALKIRAFATAPILKNGRLAACMTVAALAPRAWTAGELDLVQEVAERTWEAVERATAEAARNESEERLRLAVHVGELGTWDWNLLTGEVAWSEHHYRILGYEPGETTPSYQGWAARVHPDDLPAVEAALARSRDRREAYGQRYRQLTNGQLRWVAARGLFLHDEAGRPVRMIGVVRDVTDETLAAEHQATLLAELQHRTRNLLGVVRSVARRTADTADDLDGFLDHFDGRLSAIARTQTALTRNHEVSASLDALVLDEFLAAAGAQQVTLEGPPVQLSGKTAENLSLAIHELVTNALKYGALATPQGHVHVTWRVVERDGGPRLRLEWRETGVGLVDLNPRRVGFGRQLLERALPYELDAATALKFEPGGVRAAIEAPLHPRGHPDRT